MDDDDDDEDDNTNIVIIIINNDKDEITKHPRGNRENCSHRLKVRRTTTTSNNKGQAFALVKKYIATYFQQNKRVS
jgi:hypothetical protein